MFAVVVGGNGCETAGADSRDTPALELDATARLGMVDVLDEQPRRPPGPAAQRPLRRLGKHDGRAPAGDRSRRPARAGRARRPRGPPRRAPRSRILRSRVSTLPRSGSTEMVGSSAKSCARRRAEAVPMRIPERSSASRSSALAELPLGDARRHRLGTAARAAPWRSIRRSRSNRCAATSRHGFARCASERSTRWSSRPAGSTGSGWPPKIGLSARAGRDAPRGGAGGARAAGPGGRARRSSRTFDHPQDAPSRRARAPVCRGCSAPAVSHRLPPTTMAIRLRALVADEDGAWIEWAEGRRPRGSSPRSSSRARARHAWRGVKSHRHPAAGTGRAARRAARGIGAPKWSSAR